MSKKQAAFELTIYSQSNRRCVFVVNQDYWKLKWYQYYMETFNSETLTWYFFSTFLQKSWNTEMTKTDRKAEEINKTEK